MEGTIVVTLSGIDRSGAAVARDRDGAPAGARRHPGRARARPPRPPRGPRYAVRARGGARALAAARRAPLPRTRPSAAAAAGSTSPTPSSCGSRRASSTERCGARWRDRAPRVRRRSARPAGEDGMPWGFRQKAAFVFAPGAGRPRDGPLRPRHARGRARRRVPGAPASGPTGSPSRCATSCAGPASPPRARRSRASLATCWCARRGTGARPWRCWSRRGARPSSRRRCARCCERPGAARRARAEPPRPARAVPRRPRDAAHRRARPRARGVARPRVPGRRRRPSSRRTSQRPRMLLRLVHRGAAGGERACACSTSTAAAGCSRCRSPRAGTSSPRSRRAARAWRDAELNRRTNGVPGERLRLVASSVERALPHFKPGAFDAVVLDPPREGCAARGAARGLRPAAPAPRRARLVQPRRARARAAARAARGLPGPARPAGRHVPAHAARRGRGGAGLRAAARPAGAAGSGPPQLRPARQTVFTLTNSRIPKAPSSRP